jgi:YD repeat-containing protein
MRYKLLKCFILIFAIFQSCGDKLESKPDNFDDKLLIAKNKVDVITKIKIGLDSLGNSKWSRVDAVSRYNNKGLKIMTIVPQYIYQSPPPGGLTLRELSMIWTRETNIPNGIVDTIFYEYDERDNLKTIQGDLIITYKYDSQNNWIEKCVSRNLHESICNYRNYVYDDNWQIVYSIDSFGPRSNRFGKIDNVKREKIYYKYDEKGNILFDGFHHKYNNQGKLIETVNSESKDSDKEKYEYDEKGKLVCQTSLTNGYTNRTFFYYNDNGLIKQQKKLNEENILVELINYEYSYYN